MRIVVYGCGENGLQAFSCLRHDRSVEVAGFVDDAARSASSYLGLPVFGGGEVLSRLRAEHRVEGAVVAIGNNAVRKRLTGVVRASGLLIVSAIHPHVLLESPRRIGDGVILEMGVAIHPEAEVGDGVFVGGGAIVSHHSSVGAFSLIAGGVVFGGHVTIGPECLLGVGVSIKPHVSIGARVTVGVGAAVVTDLPDDVVAVGVPARIVSEKTEQERA
jgi:acetyltransferase EpsM